MLGLALIQQINVYDADTHSHHKAGLPFNPRENQHRHNIANQERFAEMFAEVIALYPTPSMNKVVINTAS